MFSLDTHRVGVGAQNSKHKTCFQLQLNAKGKQVKQKWMNTVWKLWLTSHIKGLTVTCANAFQYAPAWMFEHVGCDRMCVMVVAAVVFFCIWASSATSACAVTFLSGKLLETAKNPTPNCWHNSRMHCLLLQARKRLKNTNHVMQLAMHVVSACKRIKAKMIMTCLTGHQYCFD